VAVLLDITRCDRNLSYTPIVSIRVRFGGRSVPFADTHYNCQYLHQLCTRVLRIQHVRWKERVQKMGVTQYLEQLPSPVLSAECGTIYRCRLWHPRHAGGTVRIPELLPSISQLHINSNSELQIANEKHRRVS